MQYTMLPTIHTHFNTVIQKEKEIFFFYSPKRKYHLMQCSFIEPNLGSSRLRVPRLSVDAWYYKFIGRTRIHTVKKIIYPNQEIVLGFHVKRPTFHTVRIRIKLHIHMYHISQQYDKSLETFTKVVATTELYITAQRVNQVSGTSSLSLSLKFVELGSYHLGTISHIYEGSSRFGIPRDPLRVAKNIYLRITKVAVVSLSTDIYLHGPSKIEMSRWCIRGKQRSKPSKYKDRHRSTC